MRIRKTGINFIREPLAAPFGFKGEYVNELWNIVVRLESEAGNAATGLGLQSVLWSDAAVFVRYSPTAANSVMYLMTEYALQCAKKIEFQKPDELFRAIYPEVLAYGRRITGLAELRPTFALNALVPVDMAAWLLYAKENGISDFDSLIPSQSAPYMKERHDKLAGIPLITYGIPIQGVVREVDNGCFFLKVKIGSDPDKDGDREKMLAWDMRRLEEIHGAIGDRRTPYTQNGKIPYYLDANGRYDSRDRLMRLLAHADKIGALERIILLEEPFPEELKIDVSGIPARLAADESAHSDIDVAERIALGYRAVALKPIAKTMSMTFDMIREAGSRNIPCFCADLTVNPLMVDVNKNFAARLSPLPGMMIGVLESNGHQNYSNWEALKAAHPAAGAAWIDTRNGLYELGTGFYEASGGIFEPCRYYDQMVK